MVFERIRAKPPLSAAVVMMGVVAIGLYRDRPPAVVAVAAAPEPPPCIDQTVELVGDGQNAVLCWPGGTCWSNGHRVPHPAPNQVAESVATVVGSTRVCTGAQCDEVGPKLELQLLLAHDVQVTRDHEIIVLDHQVWNRVRDVQIELPAALGDEGEITRVEVLGNRVMVARGCNGWCSASTRLLDADGRQHGWSFPSAADASTSRARQVALGGDRYLVFGLMGEITLIDGGTPGYSGWIYDRPPTAPQDVDPATVVLSPEGVGYLLCDDATMDCHVGRFEVGKLDVITRDDLVVPRCGHSASSAATSAASGATSSIP